MKGLRNTNTRGGGVKDKILIVAGRLFNVYGFEKTTYRMIADELGIAPSTIAYHFHNKYCILRDLFITSMNILREYVAANLTDGFNYYLYHAIVDIHFCREMIKNDRVCMLFNDKRTLECLTGEWIFFVEDALKEITTNFQKDFNEKDIHAAAIMIIGARTGIFNEFSKNTSMSIDECCYYFVHSAGMLLRLDEATVQRNICRAFEYANIYIFPEIPFFT